MDFTFLEPESDFIIGDYTFTLTCIACPEQYDVFNANGDQVAYVRLRHGCLQVWAPDCDSDDNLIYTHDMNDSWIGCFTSVDDRRKYLTEIAKILKERK